MKRLYADDILFGDKGQCKLKLGAPLFAATESRFSPKVPADGGNKDAVDAGPSDVLIVAAGGGSSKTGVVNELVCLHACVCALRVAPPQSPSDVATRLTSEAQRPLS